MHNGVQFSGICTSVCGPRPTLFGFFFFLHFDLKMRFAPTAASRPQRRRAHSGVSFFRHLNFQKWSEHRVVCTFGHENVLRATAASNFFTPQLLKVVRTSCVLYVLTCFAPQRHAIFHVSSGHRATWLRTRRFSEPIFRPSRPTNQWKTQLS